MDSDEGDRYWLMASGYTEPPTLAMADAAAGGAASAESATVLKQLPKMFESKDLIVTQVCQQVGMQGLDEGLTAQAAVGDALCQGWLRHCYFARY